MINLHSFIDDSENRQNNLSNSDLENLRLNYRVCHLLGISLMMVRANSEPSHGSAAAADVLVARSGAPPP